MSAQSRQKQTPMAAPKKPLSERSNTVIATTFSARDYAAAERLVAKLGVPRAEIMRIAIRRLDAELSAAAQEVGEP